MAGFQLCTLARIKRFFTFRTHPSVTRSLTTSSNSTGKWQIVGAACVTRLPVVCPPMTAIEQQYSKMLAEIERELSLKSDHEVRHQQDRLYKDILKSGEADELDLEQATKQSAVEFEDASAEELKAFTAFLPKPSSYETTEVRSVKRALEKSLVLVVRQRLWNVQEWSFPQAPWQPGETLRQTCERVLHQTCGDNLQVNFLGNAPCGFYKYKYPKTIRKDGYIGAKVFFYKCQVRGSEGHVEAGPGVDDLQWLTHQELDDRLKHSYAKSVSHFLISDQ